MADVSANIVLTTTGGSEAAAEVQKATGAIQNLTSASSGMEGQFQHRFQHIGLMLFAGDALRASGLGRETRMVVALLNTTLMAGAEAGGIASGGILLVVTALVALAGIIVKVIEHHKNEADALTKLAEQQVKSYDNYQTEIGLLDQLATRGGGLTEKMQALKSADQAVSDDLKASLLVTLDKEISALEAQREKLQQSADMHALFAQGLAVIKSAIEQLLTPFERVVTFTKSLAASMAGLLPHMSTHVALTGDLKTKYDELSAAITKAKVEEQTLVENNTTDLKKLADATEQEAKERMSADDRVTKFAKEQLKLVHEEYAKAYTAREKLAADSVKKEEQIVSSSVARVGTDFGGAFAKMLVEGKSFTVEMSKAFTQMAEQIISEIIRMITEWAIFTTISGFGGPIGAFGAAGLKGIGFATGGSAMVDSPTMFMAGEAGPELVNVSPLSAGGSSGGSGQTINIGTVVTNVSGVNNPDEIARQVGQKIVEEIRGRGQISFVRS